MVLAASFHACNQTVSVFGNDVEVFCNDELIDVLLMHDFGTNHEAYQAIPNVAQLATSYAGVETNGTKQSIIL